MNLGQWFGFVCLIIALFVLWQIRHLLLLVFTAVVIAVALNRLVKWLEKKKFPHRLAVICAVSSFVTFLALFIWLVVPPFSEQLQKLLEELPRVWAKIDWELAGLESRLPDDFPDLPTRGDLLAQLPSVQELFSGFLGIFSNSVTAILQILLVFAIAVMMLADPQRYRKAFLSLFPSFYRRRADSILSLSETALGSWLQGILINCLFIGIASGIGLAILQIRLVLVHALIAGILNFIPNIGPATSVVFPLSIAVLESPWKIAAVLIWYFIIQNIETYWLSPTVMARQVSLLPAITLTAQIFFARTFGLMGLLLALPLTVVAKTWVEEAIFKDILDTWEKKK
ncbi:putative permease [Hyella patelloides LEGE 07179]|uniref:Putative permease n=1 Tax=Hyella patelloides LEGE 07179 TaxID=945734 RepID=A0A563VPS5_9CYAN|nr:AI-2E family transporter [Hyella patelloides]VEP13404.1 putative permease [Hyella patelloides LEGE 07179]